MFNIRCFNYMFVTIHHICFNDFLDISGGRSIPAEMLHKLNHCVKVEVMAVKQKLEIMYQGRGKYF